MSRDSAPRAARAGRAGPTFRGFTAFERREMARIEDRRPLAHGSWITQGVSVPPAADLAALISDTPMVAVEMMVGGSRRPVHLKLEGLTPGGSIKDRTALSMLDAAELRGALRPGSTILESTSGNLGVALALIGGARGYRVRAVVDPKTPPQSVLKMRSLGAEIDTVTESDEAGGYLLSRLSAVRELQSRSDEYVWMNQYANEANPLAHYRGTAPEVWDQMDRRVDAVLVAVSTCGTLAGLGRFFRERSPSTRLVAVDAVGSVVFGGEPGRRRLTGIGSSQRPLFGVSGLYDEVAVVDDLSASLACSALRDATGISVGGSSGAVLAACSRYLLQHGEIERVVCICPDTGRNYEGSVFGPEENGPSGSSWLGRDDVALAN